MIDPKELRIGNLVLITPFTEKDVFCLDEKSFENLILFKHFDRTSPIPLTEEWLLRFGFEKRPNLIDNKTQLVGGGDNGFDGATEYENEKYNSVFLSNEKWHYIIDQNSDDYGRNYTSVEIKHVHQLQNLYFALTNQELTIKTPVEV